MTDIPSRSFGSEKKWHCKTEDELLTLFNTSFPLPLQNSWTVFRPSSGIKHRIISALRQQALEMDEWRRLPKPGTLIGRIGTATANLWDWTLGFRVSPTETSSNTSTSSWQWCERDTTVMDVRSELQQFQRRSRPLTRRSCWPSTRNL